MKQLQRPHIHRLLFILVILFSGYLPTHNAVIATVPQKAPISEEHPSEQWEQLRAQSQPTARHEASLVAYKDNLYLIGGRRINPVDVFNTQTRTWTEKSKPPLEIHHFQAVTVNNVIYILGAMTGQWPNEKPLERVLIYYPDTDEFKFGPEIPKARRRGGAGAVFYNEKIYLIGGITNGHMDGYVNWFDAFDPKTGAWEVLPDAPHMRDHFQTAIAKDKLYAFAGRHSEWRAELGFEQTIIPGDIFNFKTGKWEKGRKSTNIPTPRAGNMIIANGNHIIVGGGESGTQTRSHSEIEAFNVTDETWTRWPDLIEGRHGSGFAIVDGYLYTASGSGNRGGGPELTTIERLKLPKSVNTPDVSLADGSEPSGNSNRHTTSRPIQIRNQPALNKMKSQNTMLWHTVTLDFKGPDTSEEAADNPFTNYRLLVEFTKGQKRYLIRGFYAADGKAAYTSATSGNIWRVRFTPDELGDWQYKASLTKGEEIAINADPDYGEPVNIIDSEGHFKVTKSNKSGTDFRAPDRGHLYANGKLFQFRKSGKYWLKGGANSPENLLGYVDFDNTYRLKKETRSGEASTEGKIHSFAPHKQDWEPGDPLWGSEATKLRGHTIIGAMNYLANQGMNAVYFLVNNIAGDGNDVWPYVNPKEFDRFDVSKLAQWNIVFDHMQSKGILLHMVTQETENELTLDGGNTEFMRSLYYQELISRFGHHLGLIWNLGEENGPAHWIKRGQNDQQRKDMAKFFAQNDPYDHPILLHSHAHPDDIAKTFTPLLGGEALDGMSLQVDNVGDVFSLTKEWHSRSEKAGRLWTISLDEIGKWYNGALPDDIDPDHNILRRHVLWGHLLAGGAGVEWYFGGKYHSNDISTEDWRTRHNLWTQTRHALNFFERYIPYWKLKGCGNSIDRIDVYCAGIEGELYVFYIPGRGSSFINLPEGTANYSVTWFDPKNGGPLLNGSVTTLGSGKSHFIGHAPHKESDGWVVLIRKTPEPS